MQSVATLVLQAMGKVNYDVFLFANVGDDSEHPGTIEYYHKYAAPFAEEHGIELHMVQKTLRDGSLDTILGRMHRLERSLPIPVRMSNGAPGKRSCTADYKIAVIEKKLRTVYGATAEQPATVGLGISLDEIERAKTHSGYKTQVLEYPLIDLHLFRRDCYKIIEEAGLPRPPKSACWFCPFHSRTVWIEMKREEPDLFAKSVALENLLNKRRARFGKTPVYLHPSCVPLANAVGDQPPLFEEVSELCEASSCMT